jgi:hypothetical protein
MGRLWIGAGSVVLLLTMCAAGVDKVTSEDVIAKSLDSIGKAEARTAPTLRTAQGIATLDLTSGGSGHMDGTMTVASMGGKFNFLMYFNASDYVGDQFKFDGQKPFIADNTTTERRNLGYFVYRHDLILKQGLWGGVWNTGWPLFDLKSKNAVLRPEKSKKIDGKDMLVFSYEPKRMETEMRIHLYFEPDTYRHVRTVYEYYGPVGNVPAITVTEEFSDFKEEHGLTLPHGWVIRLEPNASAMGDTTGFGGYAMLWKLKLNQVGVGNPPTEKPASAPAKPGN